MPALKMYSIYSLIQFYLVEIHLYQRYIKKILHEEFLRLCFFLFPKQHSDTSNLQF